MFLFEILTWTAFGLFIGAFALFLWRPRSGWIPIVVMGTVGGLAGGLAGHLTTGDAWHLNDYSVLNLLVAGVVATVLVAITWRVVGRGGAADTASEVG